jgi:hypothetical protein
MLRAALPLYPVALSLGGFGGRGPKQVRRLATNLAAEDTPANAFAHAHAISDPIT